MLAGDADVWPWPQLANCEAMATALWTVLRSSAAGVSRAELGRGRASGERSGGVRPIGASLAPGDSQAAPLVRWRPAVEGRAEDDGLVAALFIMRTFGRGGTCGAVSWLPSSELVSQGVSCSDAPGTLSHALRVVGVSWTDSC